MLSTYLLVLICAGDVPSLEIEISPVGFPNVSSVFFWMHAPAQSPSDKASSAHRSEIGSWRAYSVQHSTHSARTTIDLRHHRSPKYSFLQEKCGNSWATSLGGFPVRHVVDAACFKIRVGYMTGVRAQQSTSRTPVGHDRAMKHGRSHSRKCHHTLVGMIPFCSFHSKGARKTSGRELWPLLASKQRSLATSNSFYIFLGVDIEN